MPDSETVVTSTCRATPGAVIIGKQTAGSSSAAIYDMAEIIVKSWQLPCSARIADVGGGAGTFARRLLSAFEQVDVVEHEAVPASDSLNYRIADLNDAWSIEQDAYDAAVALEVIEHLENPRHFMRQLAHILRPGGRCFVTTPNQLSVSSKMCLVARGQFRDFSNNCYPSHITALVRQDLERIAVETGFRVDGIHYTNTGRIPFSSLRWQSVLPLLRGCSFSDNIGVSLIKSGRSA